MLVFVASHKDNAYDIMYEILNIFGALWETEANENLTPASFPLNLSPTLATHNYEKLSFDL